MIRVARYYTPLQMGTFSVVDCHGITYYFVEPAWRNNMVDVSCIPEGTYYLERATYYGGDGPGGREDYPTWQIMGVVGRGEIKVHRMNYAAQSRGCPGIGDSLGVINGHWAVLNSEDAHNRFMSVLQDVEREQIRIYQAR